jgi:hypothetical protein
MAVGYNSVTNTVTITDEIGNRPPVVLSRSLPPEEIEEAIVLYHPPTDPEPDWGGFLQQLLQSPMLGAAQLGAEAIIGAELPTADANRTEQLLRAVNALTSLTSGLAVASLPSGDSGLFVGAWLLLREASLVAPEIASAMTQLAVSYHIPQSLIDSLGAPSEPS